MDRAWLAELAGAFGGTGDLAVTVTRSGALIGYAGPVVVKVHEPRTDPLLLRTRLRAAAHPCLAQLLARPITAEVHPTPDGRSATIWPRLETLRADDDEQPWTVAGALLGRLHQVDPGAVAQLPDANPTLRLEQALRHLPQTARRPLLHRVGAAILSEVAPTDHRNLTHGDWHLGQVGWATGGDLRLIDIDDLGFGDPAWDLARPAGFWAAGLLADQDWDQFLTAYRRTGGPAVPSAGDPWPRLELPARATVVLAACRAVAHPRPGEDDAVEALLEACARM